MNAVAEGMQSKKEGSFQKGILPHKKFSPSMKKGVQSDIRAPRQHKEHCFRSATQTERKRNALRHMWCPWVIHVLDVLFLRRYFIHNATTGSCLRWPPQRKPSGTKSAITSPHSFGWWDASSFKNMLRAYLLYIMSLSFEIVWLPS